MEFWVFFIAAVLLSFERVCYIYIWRFPDTFQAFCERPFVAANFGDGPVDVLQKLFYGFKAIQFAVFFGWCDFFGSGSLLPLEAGHVWLGAGLSLIIVGQILNFGVFYRLGKIGVFYGNKFGYEIAWCQRFPFSFLDHPQYIGALLSIWGFFLATRFPHDDWYILPALETLYYVVGAYYER